jgi:predicted ATPase/DNA-binding SARP family transcriptional activator
MGAARARLSAPGRPLDNLPLELTSFIGREREVVELEELLGDRRLLTLCGPGGAGKTRLALAVAQEVVEDFEDGVWWVDLASISDPKLVPPTVAAALGVREVPDRSLAESLAEYLRPRSSLVILDNCEHLINGCAALADALLRRCPYLKILATSREPLRVAGEVMWMVPSLSLPDPQKRPNAEQLASYEALRLFVERAERASATFELTDRNAPVVARLCRRLDGIPLAIELAAARVRALTVEQISERLEDPLSLLTTGTRTAPQRHQTLRGALQWSYDLLDEQERGLFERLSVFAGGWDLEAAEAIGAEDPARAAEILDLLSMLMDKSLVVAEKYEQEGTSLRYRMLEPVRQFGREKLRESAMAHDIPRRHAEYFLAFAERADPQLLGADQARWLQRLRTELGNLRRALEWSLDREERAELRLRLVAALGRFWGREGFEEGKWWLQVALESDPGGFPVARARALGELGFILLFQQNYAPAIAALEEGVALYKELGDEIGAAYALANLGQAATHGVFHERLPTFEREGTELLNGGLAGHPRAYLLVMLGMAAQGEANLDRAASRLEEGLALCLGLGSLREASMAYFILGNVEIDREHFDPGVSLLLEGARITRELGDRLGIAYYVWGLGRVAVLRKNPVRAARLWGAAETLRAHMGMTLSPFDLAASGYERDVASVRSSLGAAPFEAAWAEGRTMSPKQAIEYALQETATSDTGSPADRPSPAPLAGGRPEEDGGTDLNNNLPAARDGFVGREREMSEVRRALSSTHLLTLTGAGGSGKTRLALEVARDLASDGDYSDGVWLVELASLTEGGLVPGAVAATLGIREQPDLPITETLVDFLRPRRMLLILDNCEHLIEDCASLVETLVSSCEHLRVMSTSREALGVSGEVNRVVPSLTIPNAETLHNPEALMRYEAVRLFVDRARTRVPAFELTSENATAVANICRALDGIPLAIELATARMGRLTVEQISERLGHSLDFLKTGERTAAPRQRTLRAALWWSYDLLLEPERELFRRLSVFAGGWTLDAAETVGEGGQVESTQVLDLLSTLVDKSLVVVEADAAGDLRYRMLEPVRQYARELLEDGGETRARHAAFFVALAEEAYPQLRAAPQVEWLQKLDAENGNLRGALSWALSADDLPTAARLGFALWPFWWIRNRQIEGRRWMEPVFLRRNEVPPWLRIRTVIAHGAMVYGEGNIGTLEPVAGELLELSRETGGDTLAEAYAHVSMGLVATDRGDFEAATPHLEEALPLLREAGEDGMAAQTPTWLGTNLLLQGDHEGARRRFEQGLDLARSLGERVSQHNALFNLAQLELAEGDYEAASLRFAEAIAPSEELGDRGSIAWILEGFGIVAGAQGKAQRAVRLLGASEAMISAIGLRGHPEYVLDRALYERIEAGTRAELGEVAFEAAFSEGRSMSPAMAIEYALEEAAPKPPAAEPAPPFAQAPEPEEEHQAQLHIYALGRARVEKGGQPIDSPDFIQKSRELLYYLLSHPEGRTKEQIGLALWPDASTSQLRSSFHDTVFRLRRALGAKEWVVFERRRYAFGGSLGYSYDAEEFERRLSEAHRLRSEAPDRAILHLQEAATLYAGDFLEDVAGGEWMLERQEELRRAYGESLLLLGALLLSRERHAEAADAYRKAISYDRLLEEAHRGLMRSQASLGEPGGAIRHYEELARMLREQLGSLPSSETIALYESLRAGK